MKKLQWLLDVADKKPLLFSILILLIAVGALANVCIDRTKKLDKCEESRRQSDEKLNEYYNRKIDSVVNFYTIRETTLNAEVKETLNHIIENYKAQLDEQKRLNDRISTTISRNQKILKTFRR